ncbi:hypothetical protein [Pseudomonas graminis]
MMAIRNISLKFIINMFAVLFIFSLSGCQATSQKMRAASAQSVQSAHTAKYIKQNDNLKKCQAQLQALKVVNPPEFNRMQSSFDNLMNSAAQYSGLRKSVDENTQDTVDSLYHYRANQLCARVAQALMDSLTSKGEARP